MSGTNRFIRIAQQPPAIVSRGDLFNFIAYFPKSSPYECQEDLQDVNSPGGQAGFPTYRSGGFATTSVIPADGRMIPLSSSSSSSLEKSNDGLVVGTGRADFNRTNEDDRTIRFELGIKRTGTFIVVVRLHRQHMRASRVGEYGSETGANSIITSIVTRKIQVVERQEENDTRSSHARYGRLTPPSMGRGEEKEYKSSHVGGRKILRTDTSFNGRRDLPRRDLPRHDLSRRDLPSRDLPRRDLPGHDLSRRDLPKRDLPRRDLPRRAFLIMARPKTANLPETETSGSNERKGKENHPDLHIPTSTPYEQQHARRDDSEPGKESWSNDGESVGANLLGYGTLIMPRPNSTLPEAKINDGDNWSDDDDSDDEGGVKLF